VVIYAALLLRQPVPVLERVAAGVSYRDMLAEAGYLSALIVSSLIVLEVGRVFAWALWLQIALIALLTAGYGAYARSAGRPLFIFMLIIMVPLATTELGTDSWITSLLEPQMAGMGLDPGWVLVYTSALMLVLRLFAGPLVHRFSPLGLLALCSVVAAAGLFGMSQSTGGALLLAATVYGVGKSFFWPTSLGLVAEQFPKGGALALNGIAGVGMLAVGIVGSVFLGAVQDRAVGDALGAHDARHGSSLYATYFSREQRGLFGQYRSLDDDAVAAGSPEVQATVAAIVADSKRTALRYVAALPLVMLLAYLGLIAYFRGRGGYAAVRLPSTAPP
jgi:MFS family permease